MQVSDTTDNMKGYTFVSSGSEWNKIHLNNEISETTHYLIPGVQNIVYCVCQNESEVLKKLT
jgi:hypothetical protein